MCSHKLIRPLLYFGTLAGLIAPSNGASAQMLTSARAERDPAGTSAPMRVEVSVRQRRLWVIAGRDTLRTASVAVAKNTTLEYAGREFSFRTPRGVRRVLRKESDPVWQPPDWLYVETAQEHGLRVNFLKKNTPTELADGRSLVVRDGAVGVMENGEFQTMPTNEHIVFGRTLFIPPLGSKNRKVEGALGQYRLDLGDGYFLHGTPYKDSIGEAVTHGCIRLGDEDIEWLYNHVPVGAKVHIY